MAPRNVRIVWGTPPVPAGRWHGGLVNLKVIPSGPRRPASPGDTWHEYRRHRLHLSVRGIFVWSLAAALVVYLAGAAFLHRRLEDADPYNRIGYLDLALPSRWAGLDRLRGQALIDQGRVLLKKGRFNEGFTLLRLGLSRHPADHEARLDIARIYSALHLRSQAERFLREGLAHGYPGREYLGFALALAADADRPADWLDLCQLARERLDALPASARSADDSLWLDQETVRALNASGRAAEALALVEKNYPEAHPFRREISILHLLESGRPAEAVGLAEQWAASAPRAPQPLRLLVRACREADDHAGTDSALDRLRALEPAKPDALLYALVQHQLAGRENAARAALDELLFRHGADPSTYIAASTLLVELNLVPILDRLETEIRERGLSLHPVLWARLQVAVSQRDWPATLGHAESLRHASGPALSEVHDSWLETVTRLARACLDGTSGTQASLVEIVTDRPGTLRLYKVLLESLLDAGRPATARQILTLAEGPYHNARSIVALRARSEAALAAAAPEPEPVRPGEPAEFASVETFEAAFAARIRNDDTPGALALLASARRVKPIWFSAAEARLDALELPVRARGDDSLRLQLLARTALARDGRAPEKLLVLAREIDAEAPAHRAHAVLLVKEILRHDATHADALRQLLVWEPRPGRVLLDTAR